MHAQYNVQIKLKSTFSPAGSSIILRLKYHQAFVDINHDLVDKRNVTKHAEHDGIETSRCSGNKVTAKQ